MAQVQENLVINSEPVFLIIQASKLQRRIWQAVARSQQYLNVVASDSITLEKIKQQYRTQPDLDRPVLFIIDIQNLEEENPYSFCREFRIVHPQWQVVLTDSSRSEISHNMRRWAIAQGATDFIPAISLEDSIDHAVETIMTILHTIDTVNASEIELTPLKNALLKTEQSLKGVEIPPPSPSRTRTPRQTPAKQALLTYRGKPYRKI